MASARDWTISSLIFNRLFKPRRRNYLPIPPILAFGAKNVAAWRKYTNVGAEIRGGAFSVCQEKVSGAYLVVCVNFWGRPRGLSVNSKP
jgi:hypothetical protein